jgi:hypothetical protein
VFIGWCHNDVSSRFMLGEMSKWNEDVRNIIVREDVQTGFDVTLNQNFDSAIPTYSDLIDTSKGLDVPDKFLRRC